MFKLKGGWMNFKLGTTKYVNNEFRFHSPSEHKINGKQYDLEMHFINERVGNNEKV